MFQAQQQSKLFCITERLKSGEWAVVSGSLKSGVFSMPSSDTSAFSFEVLTCLTVKRARAKINSAIMDHDNGHRRGGCDLP